MPRNNLDVAQIAIGAGPTTIITANPNRVGILITNLGTTDIFIGNKDVTVTTGSLLPGIRGAALSLPFLGDTFGVAAMSGSVSILEVYN